MLLNELEQLKRLSAKVGGDLTLTQGAGGNTSLKHDGQLLVKASGKWLANACNEPMFLPVDLERVRRAIPVGHEDTLAATPLVDTALRASIETSFHALLPQRVVVHVHSVNTIAWAVQRDGAKLIASLLEGLNWRWIPYTRPGLSLTRLIAERLQPGVNVWVLANHGLIVAAETVAEAEALLDDVDRRLTIEPRRLPWDSQKLLPLCADRKWKLPKHEVAHQSALGDARARFATEGSLYPDHTVFLGPACASFNEGLDKYRERWKMEPKAVVVEGAGLLLDAETSAGAEEMAACLGLVLERLYASAEVAFLDHAEVYGLMNWDAEKYRQSLTKK